MDFFQVGHEKSWFELDGPHYTTHCRSAFVIGRRDFDKDQFRNNKDHKPEVEFQRENRHPEPETVE